MPNKLNFNKWREFLNESKAPVPPQPGPTEKVLREITQDEMGHIERALEEMGPEDLAFNETFDGKNRVILDFQTLDTDSELGKFIDILERWGYSVDWQKGMLMGTKELKDSSIDNMVNDLMSTIKEKRTFQKDQVSA